MEEKYIIFKDLAYGYVVRKPKKKRLEVPVAALMRTADAGLPIDCVATYMDYEIFYVDGEMPEMDDEEYRIIYTGLKKTPSEKFVYSQLLMASVELSYNKRMYPAVWEENEVW